MSVISTYLAAIVYVLLSVFIYFNYPKEWRENKFFFLFIILWRTIGAVSVILIFTAFKSVTYEGIRYEFARIGSAYYIITTLLAGLFFVRMVTVRSYYYFAKKSDSVTDGKLKRFISNTRLHSVVFIVFSAAIFVTGYINIDVLHTTEYEVRINAPSSEQELNICLIADIHAGSGTWSYTYDNMVERVNDMSPDVIFIDGDTFDETTSDSDIKHFMRAVREMKMPRYGIFVVFGNHDEIIDDRFIKHLKEDGINILADEMTIIGDDIQLIGFKDPKQYAKSPEELFEELGPDPDKPILVLKHRPDHFSVLSELGADLVMSGHTHGFNIPQFLGTGLFGDMYYGIKNFEGMTAITTSGVSAWGFHYKWPAKSEIVNIHLTFEEKAE